MPSSRQLLTLRDMDLRTRLDKFLNRNPDIAADAFVHPDATVIGDVKLASKSSVWPRAVLRGDIERIVVGEGSNIQDGSVVHLADDLGVYIGDYVTVGHLAMIHACSIEDECLIGMHATILDGAVVGARSIIGAGAVVTQGIRIPPGSMVLGTPGRVVRELSIDEQMSLRGWAEKYVVVSRVHREKLEAASKTIR